MIHSVWRPDQGGYDYFETPPRIGLGDDLPTPSLVPTHAIGVPSTSVGRSFSGGKPIGSGPLAIGMVAPLSRAGLSGVDAIQTSHLCLAVALAAGLGWWVGRKTR